MQAKLRKLAVATTAAVLAVLCGSGVAIAAGGNIDGTTFGSITVHKFEQPVSAPAGTANGEELAPSVLSGLEPLEGITFAVQKVESCTLGGENVSFGLAGAQDAGFWAAVDGLTAADLDGADCIFAASGADETDDNGSVTFPNLALGLYLVSETSYGDNAVTSAIAPFLVTIPTVTSSDTWNYNLHAYPKNSVFTASKTKDDSAAYFFGDTVTWTTTATIPQLGAGAVPAISITESFGHEEMEYAGSTPYILTANKGITLASGDYSCEEQDDADSGPDGPHVTGVLCAVTEAGKAKLAGDVTLTLTTTTKVIGGGAITSNSTVTMGDSSIPVSATTNWGTLTVLNHLASDETVTLSGAEIKIYSEPPHRQFSSAEDLHLWCRWNLTR